MYANMREMLPKNEDCDRPKKELAETLVKRRERGLVVLRRRVRFGKNCGKERDLVIVRLYGWRR